MRSAKHAIQECHRRQNAISSAGALVFGTSRREGLIGLSTLRLVSTALTFRWLWLGLKDGLDSAALVHRAVAFRYLIQRESKIEDLAGMDLFRPNQIDELW